MDITKAVCIVHQSTPLQGGRILEIDRNINELPVWMKGDFAGVAEKEIFGCPDCNIAFLRSKGYVECVFGTAGVLEGMKLDYRSTICLHDGEAFYTFLMQTVAGPKWACSCPDCPKTLPARFEHSVASPEIVKAIFENLPKQNEALATEARSVLSAIIAEVHQPEHAAWWGQMDTSVFNLSGRITEPQSGFIRDGENSGYRNALRDLGMALEAEDAARTLQHAQAALRLLR